MEIDPEAVNYITSLSQGLPFYTHMLALHCGRSAIQRGSWRIEKVDIESGTKRSIEATSQSMRDAFIRATSSPQKDNLYTEVLMACAQANRDELGYFSAAAIREPFRKLTGKPYDIENYVQHLNKFCSDERGAVLQKTGVKHRYRYRFSNPLMQPFVLLRGLADGRIGLEQL